MVRSILLKEGILFINFPCSRFSLSIPFILLLLYRISNYNKKIKTSQILTRNFDKLEGGDTLFRKQQGEVFDR